jgi:hypothetical protein
MNNVKIIFYLLVILSNFLLYIQEKVQELTNKELDDLFTLKPNDDYFILVSLHDIKNVNTEDKTISNLDIILDTLSQTSISVKKIYYFFGNNLNTSRFHQSLNTKKISFFYSNKNHLSEFEDDITDTYNLFRWISNKYSLTEKTEINNSVIEVVEKRLNINDDKKCKADFIDLINESIVSLENKFKTLESRLLAITMSKNKKSAFSNNNQYFGILIMFIFILLISASIVVYLKLRKINKIYKVKNNII